MFAFLARMVTRRGWVIALGWFLLAGALAWIAPEWKTVTRDDDVHFFPAGYPTVVGQDLLERGFPNDVANSTFVIIGERRPGRLTVPDLEYLDSLSDALTELRVQQPELEIKGITDHRTPIIGARLLGTLPHNQGQAALIIAALKTTHESKRSRLTVDALTGFLDQQKSRQPAGFHLETTGSAAVGHDRNVASIRSIMTIHRTTILLVITILLIVYRSPLLALIPVLTIALSVAISLMAIASMTLIPGINFQVINITNLFVTVILFGAGTDYCLFLIARYREELGRGWSRTEALRHAIRQVGGALMASAGTVIIGLGMLYFSSFAKIQYTGPAIALSLAVALMAALTLTPVLLHWFRGAVFWPLKPPHHEKGQDLEAEGLAHAPGAGLWTTVANQVVRRPAAILILSIAALTPLAVVGTQARPNYDQTADLAPDEPSIVGTRVVQRYFAAGQLGPSTILIDDPKTDFRADDGLRKVAALTEQLGKLPNVVEVRAVSRPLGRPLPLPPAAPAAKPPAPASGGGFFGSLSRFGQQLVAAPGSQSLAVMALRTGSDPRYVSMRPKNPADRNHITRIEVVFRTDPFSPVSMAALRKAVEVVKAFQQPGRLFAGATIGLAGSTAMVHDLADVTNHDQHQMYVLVTLGVYAILVLLLRRPGICLYLIATVVLGYLASLGLTELVFKALHHGPAPWIGLDWKVGFFLFVILVAVGEDYNIFLMARVVEEEHKHGPVEGTRRAMAHTGGIISSCGMIMAGTFLSMLTGTLASVQQLGFALGMGVLLDTFIVRPILVPAFIILWHRLRPAARIESLVAQDEDTPVTDGQADGSPQSTTSARAPRR